MSYVKTGLGIDKSRFMVSSKQVEYQEGTAPKVITDVVARANAADAAWLATLPRCIPGNPEASSTKIAYTPPNELGWVYTNRYGKRTCSMNPVGDRNNELRAALRIVPPLIPTGPITHRDGKWIPFVWQSPAQINPRYIELVLRAYGSAEGARRADEARVSWRMEHREESWTSDRSLSESEVIATTQHLVKLFGQGGDLYNSFTKPAALSSDGEQALRHQLAWQATGTAVAGESREDEANADIYFCTQTMGLTGGAVNCCLEFVSGYGTPGSWQHHKGYEPYKEKVAKRDPSVMACLSQANQIQANGDAAKQQRLLLYAAGGMAVLVVGAALLKGRKR